MPAVFLSEKPSASPCGCPLLCPRGEGSNAEAVVVTCIIIITIMQRTVCICLSLNSTTVLTYHSCNQYNVERLDQAFNIGVSCGR